MSLPSRGLDDQALFTQLESFRDADVRWREGRVFAYVYDAGKKAEEIGKRAFAAFSSENGLDPTAFPSLRRMENEVVGIAADHLHGGPDVVGSFTSGGTESILLAVKAARDHARKKSSLARPNIVIPQTAHAAFHKAAHYLDLEAVVVPVDPQTYRADVSAMRAAVDADTVMIVGSASSYAHGVVDPIADLGDLALERDLWLHVDGCIGGFVLNYFRRLGADVPPYDFSVPGVSSISMDLHKYAYCPKGASVVMYRSPELRRSQFFACATWPGYAMVNPTVQSSKSGGPVAGAWAVLHHLGDEGYLALARSVLDATRAIVRGVNEVPGLRVLGAPLAPLVAFASTDERVNMFDVCDELRIRGYFLHPQLTCEGSPANLHILVNPTNGTWVQGFLEALRASVEAARQREPSGIGAAIAGAIAGMDPATSTDAIVQMFAGAGMSSDGSLGERTAQMNEALDALPRPVVEHLLVEYFDRIFRPVRG